MKKNEKTQSQKLVEYGAHLHAKHAPRPKVEKDRKKEFKKFGDKRRIDKKDLGY